MPCDIYVEPVDLESVLVETDRTAATESRIWPGYPSTPMRLTSSQTKLTFQAVILENEWLRVKVLPELGGRIVEVHDKRTNSTSLPLPPKLVPNSVGGLVQAEAGLEIECGQIPRPNGLSPLHVQIREAAEESDPVMLVMFGMHAGLPLSFHIAVSLEPDASSFTISLRAENRGLRAIAFESGLSGYLSGGSASTSGDGQFAVYDSTTKRGLICSAASGEFEVGNDGGLVLRRMGPGGQLGPRQVDSWTVNVRPISGLEVLTAFSQDLAIGLTEKALEVASATTIQNGTVYLHLPDGQTLESPANLYPESVAKISLEGIPSMPDQIAIADRDRNILIQWPPAQEAARGARPLSQEIPDLETAIQNLEAGTDPTSAARSALRFSESKHAAFVVLGIQAIRQEGWNEADAHLESALAFNAEDALTWWLKAAVNRHRGEANDDGSDLPNAHYLAPLEPLLRAEAFLSQPIASTKEANPILEPLADDPDAQLEVAHTLLECGLRQDAARWMDECFRHRDTPLLRYLYAWSLMTQTRMEAEAALHVQAADQLEPAGPYPCRRLELEAVRSLAEKFPQSSNLRKFAELASQYEKRP